MDNVKELLCKFAQRNKIELSFDKSFKQLTTIRCGGKITVAAYPDTLLKFTKLLRFVSKNNVKYIVLGRGSNVLASDDYYCGMVICTCKLNCVRVNGTRVTCYPGTSTAKLSQILVDNCLHGGEFLACLPASIGGAITCNAGCFNQQASNVVKRVQVWHNGKLRWLSNAEMKFGKRNSVVKNTNAVVLQAVLEFEKQDKTEIINTVNQMKSDKKRTQPLGEPSCGSVLYHEKVAVSALIDKAGLKGYRLGGAQISQKHAGFVINVDKAESKDIYLLIKHVQQVLFRNYGIVANTEVCFVNFGDNTNDVFAIGQKRNTQIRPS